MSSLDPAANERSGTTNLSDSEFVVAMDTASLPNELFRHFDHLRLAWLFLNEIPEPEATEHMIRTIRRFSVHHHGDGSRLHQTITRAFMRLVANGHGLLTAGHSFAEFEASYPELFVEDALLEYYSKECLMSESARAGWVRPDLKPLPVVAPHVDRLRNSQNSDSGLVPVHIGKREVGDL